MPTTNVTRVEQDAPSKVPLLHPGDISPEVMREFEDGCIGYFDSKDIPVLPKRNAVERYTLYNKSDAQLLTKAYHTTSMRFLALFLALLFFVLFSSIRYLPGGETFPVY